MKTHDLAFFVLYGLMVLFTGAVLLGFLLSGLLKKVPGIRKTEVKPTAWQTTGLFVLSGLLSDLLAVLISLAFSDPRAGLLAILPAFQIPGLLMAARHFSRKIHWSEYGLARLFLSEMPWIIALDAIALIAGLVELPLNGGLTALVILLLVAIAGAGMSFMMIPDLAKRRSRMMFSLVSQLLVSALAALGFFLYGSLFSMVFSLLSLVLGAYEIALVRKWNKQLLQEKPVLLFDLDGTLIDSQPLVFETFKRVFKERMPKYVLSKKELYSFFGPTLEVTFSRYFPKEEVEDVIELYQKINLSLHDEMVKPMPGAVRLLKTLKEKGYKIGIVSNKRKKVVERGAVVCGLKDSCDLVMGKEDLGVPKPDPEGLIRAVDVLDGLRDNIIYTGDNAADVDAARNMGAFSAGYSIDPAQRKALEKAGCNVLLNHLMDLTQLLEEDQQWIDKSISQL